MAEAAGPTVGVPTSFPLLARFGPGQSYAHWDLSQARSFCARITRSHYENFSVASALLPRRLVPHFYPIYAYCRWADDLADESGGGDAALGLLEWWRGELLAMYNGKASHPITIALWPTVQRFAIPAEPFLDLLVAFEQDQRVNRYETFADLLQYCRYSANPVGRLVLHLFECCDADRRALSDEICTGLQLANFWQDVRRDLDGLGRCYLPIEDQHRFGYTTEDLQARRFNPAFASLMKFEVDRARQMFARGRPLLAIVSPDCRVDLDLFIRGGTATLDRIEKQGYDVWTTRPTVSKSAKLGLLLRALGGRLWARFAGER